MSSRQNQGDGEEDDEEVDGNAGDVVRLLPDEPIAGLTRNTLLMPQYFGIFLDFLFVVLSVFLYLLSRDATYISSALLEFPMYFK